MTSPKNRSSPQANCSSTAHKYNGCSRITDYEFLAKLGEGTFGEVHQARSRRTGAIVALKKILMHNEKDGFPITALREIKLLKMLSHKNILKLEEMSIEHVRGNDRKARNIMYMVTPYMDHDLSGLLENPNVHFTEAQIKCYMLQLLEGMKYLHAQKILHRDMKAANLLINNKGILQIADFGLARHYDDPAPIKGMGGGEAQRDYTALVVTRWYRPPELLLSLKKYTTAIDLWGVGCVFGEMLVGKPILAGDSDTNQMKIICDLVGSPNDENMPGWRSLPNADGIKCPPRSGNLKERFREYGSGAINLLSRFLCLDWRARINAIDALDHPYFKNAPLPLKPGEIPTFEDSHELDRRKFRGQQPALPPAPKGGAVGMGPNQGGWGGEPAFASGEYVRPSIQSQNTNQDGNTHRHGLPPRPHDRRPAWSLASSNHRSPDRHPRRRPSPPRKKWDTYIPSSADNGRLRGRIHDDQKWPSSGRFEHRDWDRHGYDDRTRNRQASGSRSPRGGHEKWSRNGQARSRSRSPRNEAHGRARVREREPLDVYRR